MLTAPEGSRQPNSHGGCTRWLQRYPLSFCWVFCQLWGVAFEKNAGLYKQSFKKRKMCWNELQNLELATAGHLRVDSFWGHNKKDGNKFKWYLPVSSKKLYIFPEWRFLFGMVGVMWLQVITAAMSSFCSSVPASNDLEPASTIAGPQNWKTSIECSCGDKFYWSHLSLHRCETSAGEMVLPYFSSLINVIYCTHVK